ncbi:MAG TPA: hydrogenase nickel incorporation protein HypB [Burkholderiaceae bacterium]|nr:hydrogenase nickel incorporation protein HypB [Burkholderiaceae bacterium]
MCTTCGCSETDQVVYTDPATGRQYSVTRGPVSVEPPAQPRSHQHDRGEEHPHAHGGDDPHFHMHADGTAHSHAHDPAHGHGHGHLHDHGHGHAPPAHATTVTLEQQILAKNQRLAERNRGWLAGRNVVALNLLSAPGSGKTTLLERTLRDLRQELAIGVIEGDQATLNDAERIRAAGCPVVQINTGTGCHLEADMLAHGLQQLDPRPGSMVLIENVGNLVCPALFDLGERAKVVMLAVTEGEDKPLKYPHMFRASDVMLVNKIDLLPYLRFDLERCIGYAREVNPALRVLCVSAQTGTGMQAWYAFLRECVAGTRTAAAAS